MSVVAHFEQTPFELMAYPLLMSQTQAPRVGSKAYPVAQQLALPPLLARLEQLMHPNLLYTNGKMHLVQFVKRVDETVEQGEHTPPVKSEIYW